MLTWEQVEQNFRRPHSYKIRDYERSIKLTGTGSEGGWIGGAQVLIQGEASVYGVWLTGITPILKCARRAVGSTALTLHRVGIIHVAVMCCGAIGHTWGVGERISTHQGLILKEVEAIIALKALKNAIGCQNLGRTSDNASWAPINDWLTLYSENVKKLRRVLLMQMLFTLTSSV